MSKYHVPVLLSESINYLNVQSGKKYVDCTLGGGGHTGGILRAGGEVLAIDQDSEALTYAEGNFQFEISNFQLTLRKGNFARIGEIAREEGFEKVSGILFDLGVSSHQLDTPYRGFSFNQDGPLDMRMDGAEGTVTAADLVNAGGEEELARLFDRFGEEMFAKPIARAIVAARKNGKIETTNQLASIILSVRRRPAGGRDRTHPATRVFQALRIAVNSELDNLPVGLEQTIDLLEDTGRVVIISFHSLEERIVKDFFLEHRDQLEVMTDKPVTATDEEIKNNPRARSGRLRAAVKKN